MNKSAHLRRVVFKHNHFQSRYTYLLLVALLLFSGVSPMYSQNSYLLRSTLGSAGASVTGVANGQNYTVQQSIGQASVIGTFNTNGYELRQGFIQPPKQMSVSGNSNPLQAIIFPNPASENMTITLTEPANGPITVNLFDICGKKLFTNNFPATQEIKLDYLPLASGIYILEVSSGNQYYSTKLIKE